jgi:hypothetical protein
MTTSIDNWQPINLASMEFPAVMLVDYVRVYQRSGQINIGCDPSDYPTAEYINTHLDSYTSTAVSCIDYMIMLIFSLFTDPNLTTWNSTWPKNGLVREHASNWSTVILTCVDSTLAAADPTPQLCIYGLVAIQKFIVSSSNIAHVSRVLLNPCRLTSFRTSVRGVSSTSSSVSAR